MISISGINMVCMQQVTEVMPTYIVYMTVPDASHHRDDEQEKQAKTKTEYEE